MNSNLIPNKAHTSLKYFVAIVGANAALLYLQWRENGFDDLSWLLWFLILQISLAGLNFIDLLIDSPQANFAKDSNLIRAVSALLISFAVALLSSVLGTVMPVLDLIAIELVILLNFFLWAYLAISLRSISSAKFRFVCMLFGIAGLAILGVHYGAYLTPFPAVVEIFSWHSGIGRESATAELIGGLSVSHLTVTYFTQIGGLLLLFLFSKRAASLAK